MEETNKMAPIQRAAESVANWYLKNPVVRALAQLIPAGAGGAIDAFVATRYEQMLENRRRLFFEELDRGERQLSPDVIESDDFLHCFDITLRSVHRSRREEKIRLLAKLLKATMIEGNAVEVDEYEELLQIVDELSVKDLKVLAALEEYEAHYYKNGRYAGERPFEGVFHQIAAKHLSVAEGQVTDDELRGIVIRFNRTGCYALMGWRNGPAKDCSLTGIYYRLKSLVQDEAGRLL